MADDQRESMKDCKCSKSKSKSPAQESGVQVFLLKCGVQNYAWGKLGSDSEVAKLSSSADPSFKVAEDKPYAELWMGTHVNCPSVAQIGNGDNCVSLDTWLDQHPEALGSEVNEYFKGKLPFLFKVLSVKTALSIQAHPNKIHAELLHKQRPDLYKDPNHKPEMAIALTPFVGLCGFRPITEVANYLQNVMEFRTVVGNSAAVKLIAASRSLDMALHREAMRNCFEGMMTHSKESVQQLLQQLVNKVKDLLAKGENASLYNSEVLLKLNEEFPGDVGAFAIYFLNIIRLEPGEAMFLRANLPHAYLSGDCMECMACSDNVVRAGLTPKYIDVHTLVEMLDYTSSSVKKTKFEGEKEFDYLTVFRPPVPDFAVDQYNVSSDMKTVHVGPRDSASICIVIQGQGTLKSRTLSKALDIHRGSVFFISAQEEVDISLLPPEGMLIFRAYASL